MTATTQSVRKSIKKKLDNAIARAYLSSGQNDLTANSWNKINLNAVSYDLGGNYDTSLFKFTAPVTGLYRLEGAVHFSSLENSKTYGAAIYVNGSAKKISYKDTNSGANQLAVNVSDEVYLQKDAYVELYANPVNAAGNGVDVVSGEVNTSLICRLVTKEGIRQ